MAPIAPRSPDEGFAGDANASAMVERGLIVGLIALIVVLGALVLDQDIATLFGDIGIALARIASPV